MNGKVCNSLICQQILTISVKGENVVNYSKYFYMVTEVTLGNMLSICYCVTIDIL